LKVLEIIFKRLQFDYFALRWLQRKLLRNAMTAPNGIQNGCLLTPQENSM
jgi:hypothetical protein